MKLVLLLIFFLVIIFTYFYFKDVKKNYIANIKTKEIHRIKFETKRCNLNSMNDKNIIKCGKLFALYLIKYRGYNGCAFCWNEKDTDKIK